MTKAVISREIIHIRIADGVFSTLAVPFHKLGGCGVESTAVIYPGKLVYPGHILQGEIFRMKLVKCLLTASEKMHHFDNGTELIGYKLKLIEKVNGMRLAEDYAVLMLLAEKVGGYESMTLIAVVNLVSEDITGGNSALFGGY